MKRFYYIRIKLLDEISMISGYHQIVTEKIYANSFQEAKSKVENIYKKHNYEFLDL